MIIIGAGLAGLLAGNMLKHRGATIVDRQSSLPNNHSAVLRFRTSVVGDITRIPFRKVHMIKATLPWRNPVADSLAYSYKNTGTYRSDRSVNAGLVQAERYIAPADLIARLAEGLDIKFNSQLDKKYLLPDDGCISTIPMPKMMEVLGYPLRHQAAFRWVSGVNIKLRLENCDAYVSLIQPDPSQKCSRISITGNEMIIECHNMKDVPDDTTLSDIVEAALYHIGINLSKKANATAYKQTYAKILPIDEGLRRDFIYWATREYGVYSLGRFATWRPGLLLDDLVQDIHKIENWHFNNDHYSRERNRG